jgi:hypothetical protein
MGDLVHLAARRAARPPMIVKTAGGPVVSATCAVLVPHDAGGRQWDQMCAGLLAYENSRWVHTDRCLDCLGADEPCLFGHPSCPDPEPTRCMHHACTAVADVETPCTNGARGECCGCCWNARDRRGTRRWIR